jgi:hypothetical protein
MNTICVLRFCCRLIATLATFAGDASCLWLGMLLFSPLPPANAEPPGEVRVALGWD